MGENVHQLVPVLGVLTGIIIPLGVFVWLYLSDKNGFLEVAKNSLATLWASKDASGTIGT